MLPAHTLQHPQDWAPHALLPRILVGNLLMLVITCAALATTPPSTDSTTQPQSETSPAASEPVRAQPEPKAAAAPEGDPPVGSLVVQVVRRIDATERVRSSRGSMRQVITTSGGAERTLEMEAWSRDRNDKQLVVYTAPRRVAGDKILMLNQGDDIWFYTPRTDRVRHLASHARRQKVQGSDFAYEDMAGGSIEEDYTFALLGQEDVDDTPCYKLELVPTDSGPHYSRLILWADRERYLTRRIDYYEEDDLLKRLTTDDVRQIDGQWVAMRMVMENLREGGRTVMETREIEFDVDLPDQLFTTGGLRRRSR
jgi:outer membrane lipoprotein-sorting protein